MSDLYEAIGPVFDDLLKETQHALAAYAAAHPDLQVDRVVGLGGGFSMHGLLRCFWRGWKKRQERDTLRDTSPEPAKNDEGLATVTPCQTFV
jgi:hypothetical protein